MRVVLVLVCSVLMACQPKIEHTAASTTTEVTLHILGTVQDGGSPHIGCQKSCCIDLWNNPDPTRKVVSLGIIDHDHQKRYLFEATPDLPSQLEMLNGLLSEATHKSADGIFLTHAHIGHYTGLMHLGREALGGDNVPVYAMPKMSEFLSTNGPWSQLVDVQNIKLNQLTADSTITLSPSLKVTPIIVPHRDEFSETVGYRIEGPSKRVLFIPDIDKWEKWDRDIVDEISKVDYAFLDASFYDAAEINHRDISEIPHPFVVESMKIFDSLPDSERQKIHFIHLNHTNDLLNESSKAYQVVSRKGYRVARFGNIHPI